MGWDGMDGSGPQAWAQGSALHTLAALLHACIICAPGEQKDRGTPSSRRRASRRSADGEDRRCCFGGRGYCARQGLRSRDTARCTGLASKYQSTCLDADEIVPHADAAASSSHVPTVCLSRATSARATLVVRASDSSPRSITITSRSHQQTASLPRTRRRRPALPCPAWPGLPGSSCVRETSLARGCGARSHRLAYALAAHVHGWGPWGGDEGGGRGAMLPGLRATPAVIHSQRAPRAPAHARLQRFRPALHPAAGQQTPRTAHLTATPKITAAAPTTWRSAIKLMVMMHDCHPWETIPGEPECRIAQTRAAESCAYCTGRSGIDTCRRQYNLTLKIPQRPSDAPSGPEGRLPGHGRPAVWGSQSSLSHTGAINSTRHPGTRSIRCPAHHCRLKPLPPRRAWAAQSCAVLHSVSPAT